jgi:hypothetical protein
VALGFYIYKATRLMPYVFTPLKTLETSCVAVTVITACLTEHHTTIRHRNGVGCAVSVCNGCYCGKDKTSDYFFHFTSPS